MLGAVDRLAALGAIGAFHAAQAIAARQTEKFAGGRVHCFGSDVAREEI